jgi:hypothetical protein
MNKYLMIVSSRILMVSMLSLSLWVPNAHAGIIGSEQIVASQADQPERDRVRAIFDRQDVREQLQARGVDPDAARARVDALTDDEIATINGKLDSLPAGGDIIGAAVFVFLVLLVTDILGLTKVFSFTKPIRR